jgi:chlorosome envelope protein B
MANETNNDLSAALSNFLHAGSTLVQQSLGLVSDTVKGAVQVIEPLGKTAIDLIGSGINTIGSVVQNVTSAISPKK